MQLCFPFGDAQAKKAIPLDRDEFYDPNRPDRDGQRDSNDRDPGAFKGEELGNDESGKGASKSRDPLAPYPKTVL